jgi:hypothetical protein
MQLCMHYVIQGCISNCTTVAEDTVCTPNDPDKLVSQAVTIMRKDAHIEVVTMLFEGEQCVATRVPECIRFCAIKLPACASLFKRIELSHSLSKPSHCMHDRHCAVCHCIQLIESTRLKSRRHEQHVARRSDAVGHRDTEANPSSAHNTYS